VISGHLVCNSNDSDSDFIITVARKLKIKMLHSR